jgi:hypothetical protein
LVYSLSSEKKRGDNVSWITVMHSRVYGSFVRRRWPNGRLVPQSCPKREPGLSIFE